MQTRLRLMIVDDETEIRKGIATCIDWSSHGIDVVAEASNGIEAMEAARRTNPHIVITDVRMPKMDGLEFSQHLLAICPACRVLFLSGYAEFEYARQALTVGAVDYLLKPYGAEELLEKVIAVGAALAEPQPASHERKGFGSAEVEANRHLKEHFLEGLLAGKYAEQDKIEEAAHAVGVRPPRASCQAVVMEIDTAVPRAAVEPGGGPAPGDRTEDVLSIVEELFGARVQERCLFSMETRKIVGVVQSAFLSESRLLELCRKVITVASESLGVSLSIGIGGVCRNVADLHESYIQALDALKLKAGRGRGLVHVHSAAPAPADRQGPTSFRFALDKVMDSMKVGDAAGVTSAIEQAFRALPGDEPSFDVVRGSGERILAAAIELLESLGFDLNKAGISRDPIEVIATMEFLEDLRAYVLESCTQIALFLRGKMTPAHGTMVRKAIQYVREHFAEPITLSDMAQATAASPWYFSRQFSKETGESFVNWLNRYRIDRAEEIMRVEPEARIYEIAERVGFSDYKNFSANFKKYLGVRPRDYKQLPR